MTEQTTLKIAGSEIAYGMLWEPRFWLLILCVLVAIWLVKRHD